MNLKQHAERELKLAGIFDKDSDYNGALGKSVMELIEVFSKQGHSGASASRVISLFKTVVSYKNLMPLTGENKEWNEISETRKGLFQNNRVSSVFKKNNKAYYLYAIIWKTQKGSTWSGNAKTEDGEEIRSRQYIKSFPFMPKTFYIDVIEKEISKGNWEFTVKDRNQLKEVFEYYNKS